MTNALAKNSLDRRSANSSERMHNAERTPMVKGKDGKRDDDGNCFWQGVAAATTLTIIGLALYTLTQSNN